MTTAPDRRFATLAIHAGQSPDATTGAIIPPIFQSSTHVQDGVGVMREGYEYNRSANPTRTSLQEQLAALEGADHAFSFASGLAAEDALLRGLLTPGDHIVIGNDVYGGTYRLINRVFGAWGVEHSVVDLTDAASVEAGITERSRILWVETPSNPLLSVVDIAALAELGHRHGLVVVVDNTFATPALQQPLALGADVVVHSTTKYIGGHSDVLGGAVVTSDADIAEKVGFQQFAVGGVSAPMDAWLTTRGLKTLDVRMRRHSENAARVAEALGQSPAVERVYYPGLADHPGHAIAARQMRGFGGMVSVTLTGGPEAAAALVARTRVFQLAESLGGVESLISLPARMTHASVVGTELEVPANLVRLSVGIEDVDDLVEDLTAALAGL
ncbi:cystathionine gamma-synthase [Mycetocola reblochoni]|uniref:Cystathionine gamma-synthase n=2 Tax=Mycetocola reblochoni TaxID=331618 RepID=A0A1R4JXW2_9MICO|nr:cystathionine gamma-synthase [Mycetocola reblochoni]RLP70584.1 cystathionine gamma-synthase [Mycetocola reblochoni]SJN36856.1 Cystathionine gamma-lyase [Mycetocola reblochoni REB411]